MKLAPKMVGLFTVIMVVAMIVCLGSEYLTTRSFIVHEAEDRAAIMAKVIESQLHLGNNAEDEGGANSHFQDLVTSLKESIPQILEINLYKIASESAVASTDRELVGKKVDPEDVEAAKADRTVILQETEDGKPVVDITAPLHYQGSIGYVVGIKISTLAEKAFSDSLLLRSILIGLVALSASAVLIVLSVRRITTPLVASARNFELMAQGDLDQTLPVTGSDELRAMAASFNSFIRELRTIITGLKESGEKSTAVSTQLVTSTTSVARSAEEIATTMNRMNEQTSFLNGEIDTANGSMRAIKDGIDRINALITEQAASVQESSASVEQMIANVATIERATENKQALVTGLLARAKDGEESMVRNVEAIAEIAKSARFISDLISVINGVASQTNLLAMNAAIEAAHAGEAGKGFSVVSDEIRKLSEMTSQNARDISVSLKSITDKISETSIVTATTSRSIAEVLAGIRDVADSLSETLNGLKEISVGNRQITESITNLNKLTVEVSDSGKVIVSGTDRVDESMKSIHRIAEENRAGIEGITKSIGDISKAIGVVADLSVTTSETIRLIETDTGRFSI